MAVEREAQQSPSATSESAAAKQKPLKIILRRLPRQMTEDEFRAQLDPLPDDVHFLSFHAPDPSLDPWCFARAYLRFTHMKDVVAFRDRFDGYVFVDSQGNESAALVELAPFQKFSLADPDHAKEADEKCGTIQKDEKYKAFLAKLQSASKEEETKKAITVEDVLYEIDLRKRKMEELNKQVTPLVEYVMREKEERQQRKLDRLKSRAEEREKRRYQEWERRQRKKREKEEQQSKAKEQRDRDREIWNSKLGDDEEPAAGGKAAGGGGGGGRKEGRERRRGGEKSGASSKDKWTGENWKSVDSVGGVAIGGKKSSSSNARKDKPVAAAGRDKEAPNGSEAKEASSTPPPPRKDEPRSAPVKSYKSSRARDKDARPAANNKQQQDARSRKDGDTDSIRSGPAAEPVKMLKRNDKPDDAPSSANAERSKPAGRPAKPDARPPKEDGGGGDPSRRAGKPKGDADSAKSAGRYRDRPEQEIYKPGARARQRRQEPASSSGKNKPDTSTKQTEKPVEY